MIPESTLTAVVRIATDKIRKDGKAPLYLKVSQSRVSKKIWINMYWFPDKFDSGSQTCKASKPGDKEYLDRNLELGQIRSRINEIFTQYRLANRPLDSARFIQEFNEFESRECFLQYALNKSTALLDSQLITRRSYLGHRTAIGCLQKFAEKEKTIVMSKISLEMVKKFDVFLKAVKKYQHNTITGTHKTFKTYLNHAIADGYRIENPYSKISFRFRDGERAVLDITEVNSLKKLLDSPDLTNRQNEVLRKFLFSCYTGIRISDNSNILSSDIKGNVMQVKMKKGKRFGKEVFIPLPDYAKELIAGRKGQIFTHIHDKTVNEELKIIAAHAKIRKRLTFHVSRDTFGTLFIELGGDLPTLMELMGHSDIKTTMIYVKISDKRKEKLMSAFNSF